MRMLIVSLIVSILMIGCEGNEIIIPPEYLTPVVNDDSVLKDEIKVSIIIHFAEQMKKCGKTYLLPQPMEIIIENNTEVELIKSYIQDLGYNKILYIKEGDKLIIDLNCPSKE